MTSRFLLLMCCIPLICSAQHYPYKFTMDGTTYYGIAMSTSGVGQFDSQWMEIVTVQETEGTLAGEVDVPTLVQNYSNGGRKQFLLNAAIAEKTDTKEWFDKAVVTWTKICVIEIETFDIGPKFAIFYELHKTFSYKLTMKMTTYYGMAETISGPTKSLWMQILTVEMVSGRYKIDETMPIKQYLTNQLQKFRNDTRLGISYTTEELTNNLCSKQIRWTDVCVIAFDPATADIPLALSYQLLYIYYNMMLLGETYYGFAEDISDRSGRSLMQIQSVEAIENCQDGNPILTTQRLTQKYMETNQEVPIFASIAEGTFPTANVDKSKLIWREIRTFAVEPLHDNSTLTVSYEVFRYCHYKIKVLRMVYYGNAEMGVNPGKSPWFKITDLRLLGDSSVIVDAKEFMTRKTISERRNITDAAISPIHLPDTPCDPNQTKWISITITSSLKEDPDLISFLIKDV